MIHIVWGENTTADAIVDWTSDWVGRNLPGNVDSLSWDEVKNQLFKGRNVYRDLPGNKTLLLRIDTYDWVNDAGKVTETSKNWGNDSLFYKHQGCEVNKLGDYMDSKLAFHVDYYYINDNVVGHLTTIEKPGWKTADEGRLGQLVPDYTPGKFKVHVFGKEEHFNNYGEVIEYFTEKAESGIEVAENTPTPTPMLISTSTPVPASTPTHTATEISQVDCQDESFQVSTTGQLSQETMDIILTTTVTLAGEGLNGLPLKAAGIIFNNSIITAAHVADEFWPRFADYSSHTNLSNGTKAN